MADVAYEPRSGFEDVSGSVSLPDGSAYDVGEALKDGPIVLHPDKAPEERFIAEALDAFPGLKRAEVPKAERSSAKSKE